MDNPKYAVFLNLSILTRADPGTIRTTYFIASFSSVNCLTVAATTIRVILQTQLSSSRGNFGGVNCAHSPFNICESNSIFQMCLSTNPEKNVAPWAFYQGTHSPFSLTACTARCVYAEFSKYTIAIKATERHC